MKTTPELYAQFVNDLEYHGENFIDWENFEIDGVRIELDEIMDGVRSGALSNEMLVVMNGGVCNEEGEDLVELGVYYAQWLKSKGIDDVKHAPSQEDLKKQFLLAIAPILDAAIDLDIAGADEARNLYLKISL